MGGPWEKYAQPQASGPWTKYQTKAADSSDSESDSDFNPQAAIQGFGNMATSGYLPELTGLAGKLVPNPNAGIDAKLKAQGFDITQPDFNGVTTDESRAMQKQMADESPYSYYGGGAAGAIASAPAYGALLKSAGIAKTVAPVASDASLMAKAGNLGSRAWQGAKEGAALAFASNPNTQEGDQGLSLDRRFTNAAVGGVIGGAIPVASDAVKGSWNAGKTVAQWAGSKALSNLGGVKPDTIKEYVKFADRINSAPNEEALKTVSDDFVGKLFEDVQNKKLTMEQAQDAYRGLQSDLKDAYKTAGYDARDAVTSAKQTLNDAYGSRLQQVSGDVYNIINQLKSDLKAGSEKALDTLDKSNALIDVSPVQAHIDDTIAKLKKSGTDEALGVADKLEAYKSRNLSDDKVAAIDAKKLIQGLDQITEYNPNAGTFDKAKNAAFKGVRGSLDEAVKSAVPEYADAMKPVADDADLLGRVKGFGDKQSAVGLLGRIHAPNQLENKAALQELGKKYNIDYLNAVNPESLPENQFLTKAQAAKDALRPDRVSEKLNQTLAASREKSALDSAQSAYNTAQENLAPFKPLAPNSAGQTQAQQKLAQLAKGGNIETEEMFRKLGKLTDTDFIQAMHDQNILAQFQKGATNGSRNTVFGSVIGTLSGYALGGGALGAAGGASTGASFGRIVDQYGPAVTKKLLDGALKVSKNPTFKTIQDLNLPEPVKRNMIVGLENYLSKGQANAESAAFRAADSDQKANRSPAKRSDAWPLQGAQKLGIQDQELMNRLMQDPKGKQLLNKASDLTPGSKAMQRINDQIQKGFGKRK